MTSSGGLAIDKDIVLKKVFKKHENIEVYYLYVVDSLDILGSLREELIFSLLEKGIRFGIVLNKYDLLNQKYLAQNLVYIEMKKLLRQIFLNYQKKMAASL
jgi:ribosome biogenesis GTPase A